MTKYAALIVSLLFSWPGFVARGATDYTWTSPSKHLTAVWSIDAKSLAMKIVDSSTTPPAILLEGGGGAPDGSALTPPVVGFWSDDEKRLFVASVYQNEMHYLQVSGDLFQYSGTAEGTGQAHPHFEERAQVYPDVLSEEAADGLASVNAQWPMTMYGMGGLVNCQWQEQHLLKLDHQQAISFMSMDRKAGVDYLMRWTVVCQLSTEGFKTVQMGPLRYAVLDAQKKPGAWRELPQSDGDRLRVAVRLGEYDTVAHWLAKGVNPNADGVANLTAIAAAHGQREILKLLIESGADIDRKVRNMPSPLRLAVSSKDPEILAEVLKAKSKRSEADIYAAYATLLVGAESAQNREAGDLVLRKLEMLSQASLTINAVDQGSGLTPLIFAVKSYAPSAVVQKIVALGADPSNKNKDGKTAADLAAETEQIPSLRLVDSANRYASLTKAYEIPADSPFIGTWEKGDHMLRVTLRADGSGLLQTLFNGLISWKIVDGQAQIAMHLIGANQPGVVLQGMGRLGSDGKSLLFTCKELSGDSVEPLQRVAPGQP